MIVLADDPFFARNIQRTKNRHQRFFRIAISNFHRRDRWRLIDGITNDGRSTVVKELHRHIAHDVLTVLQLQTARGHEFSDDACFDTFCRTNSFEFGEVRFGHREHHAFLSFRNPNLGVGKSFVLHGCLVEPNFSTEFFAHLADRT